MSQTNPLRVRHLIKAFKYDILSGENSLDKEIITAEVMVPGVELLGFYDYADFTQGIVLGEKECVYISQLSEENQSKCFDYLTHEQTPFIVISENVKCPQRLLDIAKEKDLIILSSEKKSSRVAADIASFNISKLAPTIMIHGTLVEVYGSGVILKGDSGVGKSEIALELIKRGHRLIADDTIIAYRRLHHLYGKAPEHQKSLLEVRGLGIIDVYRLFGITSVLDNGEIKYIIELTSIDDIAQENRLTSTLQYEEYIGLKCPIIKLPVTGGRNMADLVEVAVMTLRDRTMGHNTTQEFMEKFDSLTKGAKKHG